MASKGARGAVGLIAPMAEESQCLDPELEGRVERVAEDVFDPRVVQLVVTRPPWWCQFL